MLARKRFQEFLVFTLNYAKCKIPQLTTNSMSSAIEGVPSFEIEQNFPTSDSIKLDLDVTTIAVTKTVTI
jgi:hypothetical protein